MSHATARAAHWNWRSSWGPRGSPFAKALAADAVEAVDEHDPAGHEDAAQLELVVPPGEQGVVAQLAGAPVGPAVDEVAPHVDGYGAFLDKVRERVGFSAVGALRGRVCKTYR